MSSNINDVNASILEENNGLTSKFLTFYLDNQIFAIPVANVIQIVGIQKITSIPEYPDYAKGIINLRDSMIPVIDMRLRLKRTEQAYNERTCTIVTNIHDTAIGLIVDGVDEVVEITSDKISSPPNMKNKITQNYVSGIAKLRDKIILLLDTDEILYRKDFETLTQTNTEVSS